MKTKIVGWLAVLLLIPWPMAIAKADRVEKRVALVIGNGAYRGKMLEELTNPVHDADDISEALRGFKFEVKSYKNLDRVGMLNAITEFGKKAGHADAALFYFAGHGLQIKSRNYLIPIDATAKSEALVSNAEGVDVNYILEEMDNAGSKINMVMLDACRNNAFSGQFRGGRVRGLAAPTAQPKGTVIVYATDPGNVAADGEGRNGLFTAGLLTGFLAKDSSLGGVLLKASTYVEEKSGRKQTPYVNGPETVKARFKFRLEGEIEVPVGSPGASGAGSSGGGGQSDRETVFWQSAQGDPEMCQEYLRQWPQGVFAALARKCVKGKLIAVPDNDEEGKRLEAERKVLEADRRKLEEEKRTRDEADRQARQTEERKRFDAERKAIEAERLQLEADRKAQEGANRKSGEQQSMGMEFVPVPGRAFELGKYEVTQGQWEKMMGTNPSYFSSCGDNCPVEQVSWNDAQDFIGKMNQRGDGYTYRLPTEAEWEYACSSGGKNEEYFGGNDAGSVAWYDNNSGKKTHPVGGKAANGLGLHDMSGNVWEWVQDIYESGSFRVFRGGSWYNDARSVRCANRFHDDPGFRYSILGFRVARTAARR